MRCPFANGRKHLRSRRGGATERRFPAEAFWRWAAALFVATWRSIGWCLFQLKREESRWERDSATGVIVGLDSCDWGPTAADDATTAVLLLHGFVGSWQDFADLGERLAAGGLHVRAPRLPGHATTPRDFARQNPDAMLAAAVEEFRALSNEYQAVYVVGFSMGGALGTLLAAGEPVDRLVLAAPYYGVTYRWFYVLRPEWWNSMLGWAIPYVYKGETFVKVNRREDVGRWFSYATVPTRGVKTLTALGRRARDPKTLGAVDCPVLMITSVGDEAASPHRARRAMERIGSDHVRELWLERSNHHIFWDWERELVKQAIADFLTAPRSEVTAGRQVDEVKDGRIRRQR